MEDEKRKDEGPESPARAFELLSQVEQGLDITVRDDQYGFPALLDAVKLCRKRGFRFRLIDSGLMDSASLEWLAEAGADLYTSDEARSDFFELTLLTGACRRGRSHLAYFHYGPLTSETGETALSFSALRGLAEAGACFYLTDREQERDVQALCELAFYCRRGGSGLVYYHYRTLTNSLNELSPHGVWLHLTDRSLPDVEDNKLVLDMLKPALSQGLKLVLHVEKGLDPVFLSDLLKAGAFILFRSSLFDYRSPFRALARKASQKRLDFRAFYLYSNFLP